MNIASFLLVFAFFGAATAPAPDPGLVILVARETVTDPALSARIDVLVGDGERVELYMTSDAPTEVPGRRCIAPEDLERANDVELASALRGAAVIELRGGSFMDWYKTLLPPNVDTRVGRALRAAWRGGAHIVAHGRAASFAAGATTIQHSELERTQRNPRDLNVETTVVGLGFGPRGIVDAPGWHVGDASVLLHQLWKRKLDLGYYLQGEVALVVQFAPYRVTSIGAGSTVLFDLDDARRQKRAIRRGRMSLLGDGDSWDFTHQRVIPAAGATELARRPEAGAGVEPPVERTGAERFDPRALLQAFASVPEAPPGWRSSSHALSLWMDEDSRRWRSPAGDVRVAGVAFDLSWD